MTAEEQAATVKAVTSFKLSFEIGAAHIVGRSNQRGWFAGVADVPIVSFLRDQAMAMQREVAMLSDDRALVLRHHGEIWSKGNLDAVDEIYAPDFIGHHPGMPEWIGPESVKLAVKRTREAFPDFQGTAEDVIIEGAKVVTRFTPSGTHLGVLRGLSPTGKRIAMAEVGIFRIANG